METNHRPALGLLVIYEILPLACRKEVSVLTVGTLLADLKDQNWTYHTPTIP